MVLALGLYPYCILKCRPVFQPILIEKVLEWKFITENDETPLGMGDNFSEFCIHLRQFILIGRAVFCIGNRVRWIFLFQHLRQHADQLFLDRDVQMCFSSYSISTP